MPRETELAMNAGRLDEPRDRQAKLRPAEEPHAPGSRAEEIEDDRVIRGENEVSEGSGRVGGEECGVIDDLARAVEQRDVEPLFEGDAVRGEEEPTAVERDLRFEDRPGHDR